MITPDLILAIMPGCKDPVGWAPELSSAMTRYKIQDPDVVAVFLAQIAVESAEMNRLEENLSYSAKRLCQVWPSRFPTLASAEPYANNSRALANKVYSGRMGNGGPETDDGWKYRGRGLKMITGRANYTALAQAMELPFVSDPHLLTHKRYASLSAAHFWCSRPQNLSYIADDLPDDDDNKDFETVTKIINGGLIGIADRRKYWKAARKALGLTEIT